MLWKNISVSYPDDNFQTPRILHHDVMKNNAIITATQQWIEAVIIAHNFCPFAWQVFQQKSIHYEVVSESDIATVMSELMVLIDFLKSHEEIETAFLILDNNFESFHQFIDLIDLSNDLLIDQGEEGHFQLAHFHPLYCFEGLDNADAANFTNRSPFPMLHILREQSIEQALMKTATPEEIPLRNINHARNLGAEKFIKQLADIMKNHNGYFF